VELELLGRVIMVVTGLNLALVVAAEAEAVPGLLVAIVAQVQVQMVVQARYRQSQEHQPITQAEVAVALMAHKAPAVMGAALMVVLLQMPAGSILAAAAAEQQAQLLVVLAAQVSLLFVI
jgi:hypothetical protein